MVAWSKIFSCLEHFLNTFYLFLIFFYHVTRYIDFIISFYFYFYIFIFYFHLIMEKVNGWFPKDIGLENIFGNFLSKKIKMINFSDNFLYFP